MRAFPALIVLVPALTGCMLVFPVPNSGRGCQGESADWFPAADVVRVRGATELECPVAELGVERIGENSYRVTGCGVFEDYTCESDAVPGCNLEEAAERESCATTE